MGRLVSCVEEISTKQSFCIIKKMDLCTAGNIPIMNELDCPLIEESHRYEVIPSVSVLHSISILHECGTSCTLQTSLKDMHGKRRYYNYIKIYD